MFSAAGSAGFYFLVRHQQHRQVPQYFILNVLMNYALFVLAWT